MAENKTQKTDLSVTDFLNSLPDETKRRDSFTVLELMKQVSGSEPKMWGASIVGFGRYHYKYGSGREADWMQVAFSPRKNNITLYMMSGFAGYENLLKKLGKHSCGKGCLYVKRLSDVHIPTLEKLVNASVKRVRAMQRAQLK